MAPELPYWRVRIEGRLPDLELLAGEANLQDVSVLKDGELFFMLSGEFDELSDAAAIQECAAKRIMALNSTACFCWESFVSVTIGNIEKIGKDGSKQSHVITRCAVEIPSIRAEGGAVVVSINGIVKRDDPAESMFVKADRCANGNADFSFVLDLLRTPTWVNLYKIHERMRSIISRTDDYLAVIRRSDNELERFTRTANTESRHDPKKFKPHKRPMSHAEAVAFIRTNVGHWLETIDGK